MIRAPEQVWTTQQSLAKVQGQALTRLNTEVTALSNAIDSLNDATQKSLQDQVSEIASPAGWKA